MFDLVFIRSYPATFNGVDGWAIDCKTSQGVELWGNGLNLLDACADACARVNPDGDYSAQAVALAEQLREPDDAFERMLREDETAMGERNGWPL